MSKAVLDVSMSLDGFTAGPNVGNAEPMGEGGERLHDWMWMAGNGPDGGVDIGFRTVDARVGGRWTREWGDGGPSTSAWARGAARGGGGPASRASWSPTGPGRTCSATTVGRSPSMGWRPQPGVPGMPRGQGRPGAGCRRGPATAQGGPARRGAHPPRPLLMGEGTPLLGRERAELIPEGKPVAGAVTHLRYRVPKP